MGEKADEARAARISRQRGGWRESVGGECESALAASGVARKAGHGGVWGGGRIRKRGAERQ